MIDLIPHTQFYILSTNLPRGVIGNTADSGSAISGSSPDGATNLDAQANNIIEV